MGREIKFDYILKSRVGDHYTHNYLTLDEIQQGIYIFHFVADELVARRQFTGIKDRHGVDIYEGDILCVGTLRLNYFVEYVSGWAAFAMDNEASMDRQEFNDYTPVVGETCEDLEVVGNIYENQELIEGG